MPDYTRDLIHVPILHSPTDMGEIAGRLEAAYVAQFGRQRWHEHLALINHFWQTVAAAVEGLNLDWAGVDLYQDGLPVVPPRLGTGPLTDKGSPLPSLPPGGGFSDFGPLAIARQVAQQSENYQLLLRLVDQGARLLGTEDPQLLIEEYRAIKGAKEFRISDFGLRNEENSGSPKSEIRNQKSSGPSTLDSPATLLARRDAYIAARIDQTLQPGRTGLLFLGLLHDIRPHLPADIVIRRLDVFKP